jgi:hypothetical protein
MDPVKSATQITLSQIVIDGIISIMPVFNATTETNLRTPDPRTDQKLPDPGSLSYGSITGTSAVSGTTGVDCMLVSGDRWQQMTGNLTEHYSANKTIKVQGKHDETVQGNHSLTVTAGNQSISIASGNVSRSVPSGKVSDRIGQNYDVTVNMSYSLTASMNFSLQANMNGTVQAGMDAAVKAMSVEVNGSALVNVSGGMVMINS